MSLNYKCIDCCEDCSSSIFRNYCSRECIKLSGDFCYYCIKEIDNKNSTFLCVGYNQRIYICNDDECHERLLKDKPKLFVENITPDFDSNNQTHNDLYTGKFKLTEQEKYILTNKRMLPERLFNH